MHKTLDLIPSTFFLKQERKIVAKMGERGYLRTSDPQPLEQAPSDREVGFWS